MTKNFRTVASLHFYNAFCMISNAACIDNDINLTKLFDFVVVLLPRNCCMMQFSFIPVSFF